MSWITQKLLILAKTYPTPSAGHSELTCTAALTPEGKMIRIYPVPFRCLKKEAQFPSWAWIQAPLRKTLAERDDRPESHKIIFEDIKVIFPPIGSDDEWEERLNWLSLHIVENFDSLDKRRETTGETLGIIRPSRLSSLRIYPMKEVQWTEEQLGFLKSDGYYTAEESRNRPLLRKIPFRFYYLYECTGPNGVSRHHHKILDCEICERFWEFYDTYGADGWEAKFREKYEHEFAASNLHLLMGNLEKTRSHWVIVGVFNPPR